MVDACMAAGLNLVPVPCDDDGILPSKLEPLLPGAKVLHPGEARGHLWEKYGVDHGRSTHWF